ncbi:hypothetical protein FRC01_010490, partial [Tulasnella sp. 417]
MMRPTRPLRLNDSFPISVVQSEGVMGAAFWDFELCPPPPGISGAVFVNKIRDEMCSRNATYFGLFKVYTTAATPIPEPFKTELLNSGAQICEGDGSMADKIRRIVDILTWGLTAWRPAAIIFISSDPDFASVLSALRNANCDVSLLLHPDARSSSLLDYAADVLEWNHVFNLTTPPRDFQLFKHLVDVLQQLNDQTSQEWHAWGTVSNMLVELDPDVYKKVDFRFR